MRRERSNSSKWIKNRKNAYYCICTLHDLTVEPSNTGNPHDQPPDVSPTTFSLSSDAFLDNTLQNAYEYPNQPVLLNGSMNLPEADVTFETGNLFYIINTIMP